MLPLPFYPGRHPPFWRNRAFIDLFTTEGFPGYPPLSQPTILFLAHTIVLLGPVSTFTTSKEEGYGLDSFHKLHLRTVPCSPLNPV